MSIGIETIREQLTHLENALGPFVENKNQSMNGRLAYDISMEERVVW